MCEYPEISPEQTPFPRLLDYSFYSSSLRNIAFFPLLRTLFHRKRGVCVSTFFPPSLLIAFHRKRGVRALAVCSAITIYGYNTQTNGIPVLELTNRSELARDRTARADSDIEICYSIVHWTCVHRKRGVSVRGVTIFRPSISSVPSSCPTVPPSPETWCVTARLPAARHCLENRSFSGVLFHRKRGVWVLENIEGRLPVWGRRSTSSPFSSSRVRVRDRSSDRPSPDLAVGSWCDRRGFPAQGERMR